MRSFFRSQSPRLTSTCGRSLNCLSIQVSAHWPASIFVIIVIIVIVNSSLFHHRQFVTSLIIAIIIDTAEKSMIVKWWWLQRQKFIVSWESLRAQRSASELVHSSSLVQILEHTQSPALLQILVQKSCTFL